MTSSRSKPIDVSSLDSAEGYREFIEEYSCWVYKVKCEELVVRWYFVLEYTDLESWFDSNRCCIPLYLASALRNGKSYIKINTTL